MKRIVLPLLFAFLVTVTFAQDKDIKKATSLVDDKKYDEAKTQIDGILAKDPNNTVALYLKSKVDVILADNAAKKGALTGDPYGEAFDAFKKAIVDSTNPKLTLMVVKDNYGPIFGVYSGYFSEGANAFNEAAPKADTAGFAKAMNLFIKADNAGQYIRERKWANIGKVDTTLVLNIAKAALNSKNNAVAKKYFEELADAHIKGMHNEKDTADPAYELPYQWLTLDYKQAGDSANMVKYAAEIFSYVYNSDEGTVINDKDALLTTLQNQLEKAHSVDPQNPGVNLLYSQYYYNKGIIALQDADKIKTAGITPDQKAKKADLTTKGEANLKQAVPYAEDALKGFGDGFKKSERSKYKSVANILQNIYQSLGDKANLKKYQDIYDGA